MESKHSAYDLAQMQSLPLGAKIRMSKERIRQWYDHYNGEVYVSFSGGKDSTVLLHLVRSMYPEVEAVFVDTGLEYPELRNHVKTFDNVTWLKPSKNFKQVVLEYGYPFPSKEISNTVHYAKNSQDGKWVRTRLARLNGTYLAPDGTKSAYNCEKWKFLLEAPFEVHDYCCTVMKKNPTKEYEKKTGKKPILGMLAEESRKRKQAWVKTGCNAFESKRPQSNPMAFWTENDVLLYIKTFNITIPSVYGDIVETGNVIHGFIEDVPELKTTGCNRTGCMFCMFGCQRKGDDRFVRMKETHPKQYDYCMKPVEQGGLGMKEVIDWINENGNVNIQY